MNDTSPEMAQKVIEMMQERTPQERLMMGCSMTATSRLLVMEAIKREYPDITPARVIS